MSVVPFVPQSDETLCRVLRELLAEAEAGTLRGVAFVSSMDGNLTGTGHCLAQGADVMGMLGEMSYLKQLFGRTYVEGWLP